MKRLMIVYLLRIIVILIPSYNDNMARSLFVILMVCGCVTTLLL